MLKSLKWPDCLFSWVDSRVFFEWKSPLKLKYFSLFFLIHYKHHLSVFMEGTLKTKCSSVQWINVMSEVRVNLSTNIPEYEHSTRNSPDDSCDTESI
jgi:hypothetical protein